MDSRLSVQWPEIATVWNDPIAHEKFAEYPPETCWIAVNFLSATMPSEAPQLLSTIGRQADHANVEIDEVWNMSHKWSDVPKTGQTQCRTAD